MRLLRKERPPDGFVRTEDGCRTTEDGCRRTEFRRRREEDGENGEADTWLDYAKDCGYLSKEQHATFTGESEQVGKMLGSMLKNPKPFLLKEKI